MDKKFTFMQNNEIEYLLWELLRENNKLLDLNLVGKVWYKFSRWVARWILRHKRIQIQVRRKRIEKRSNQFSLVQIFHDYASEAISRAIILLKYTNNFIPQIISFAAFQSTKNLFRKKFILRLFSVFLFFGLIIREKFFRKDSIKY